MRRNARILIIIAIITVICGTTLGVQKINLNNFERGSDNILGLSLGLDLQGGSYLVLEVDNQPVITQKLQNKLTSIRKFLNTENIKFKNLKLSNSNIIIFETEDEFIEKLKNTFQDKESSLNPYYQRYKSHEFEYSVSNNIFEIKYSKYGLIELKNGSLDQALEIVRRRVDEIGTNEPNIVKNGTDRILVELPGLDDPTRIKSLLGKTANLTFRFVSQNNEDYNRPKN